MLTKYFSDARALQRVLSTPAAQFLEDFAQELEGIGYTETTIQNHLRAAAHLSHWQRHRGFSIHQLDEGVLEAFRRHLGSCTCLGRFRAYHHHGAGAQLFLRHLRNTSVVTSPSSSANQATEPPLLVGFRHWMRQHRGVTDTTTQIYGLIITDLLQTLGEDPQQLDAARLRAFVLDRANRHGRSKAKLVMTSLRMFLRYLISGGRCHSGLDKAIPTIADWRLASLPQYLPASEVDRIIAACDPKTAVGARDRAIMLLLSRLGLRGGDIVALRLHDIDWEQATIRVSGKSRTTVRLPLPQEVGEAILNYLEYGRPASKTDHVFVRVTVPVGPFAKASAVSDIVKRAMRRAGVSAPSCGAHVLRHSAATQMLRQGASLEDIGVILRHRSMDTTTHYAKVDIDRLRQIAQPWPEVSPC